MSNGVLGRSGWSSAWGWGSLELSSAQSHQASQSDATAIVQRLDNDVGPDDENIPLLPSSSAWAIPSASASASSTAWHSGASDGPKDGGMLPEIRTSASPFSDPSSREHSCKKAGFTRKSVQFAEPSEEAAEASTSAHGPHRWQKTPRSAITLEIGGRRSSLAHASSSSHGSFCHHNHDCAALNHPPPSLMARIRASMQAFRSLGREVLALYHALHDERATCCSQVLPWLIVILARSPLSPIPDFLPILGLINNLFLMPGLIWLAIKSVPPEILADARRKAMDGPVLLPRTWPAPVLIFLFWLALLELTLHAIIRTWSTSLLSHVWLILGVIAAFLSGGFALWLVSMANNSDGEWEVCLMYGVEYKEMRTLHWLEDAAPQVSHRRHAAIYEGGPVTP